MATIYLADDRATGTSVAIKVPHLRIESDPVSFGRFERERRIGEALDDPFLLKFIRVPGTRSRPYIATEFLDGATLGWVLHRTHPLPEQEALRIAAALCEALAAMHAAGVVHRDLKPGNVMICRDGRLCLMDFGLAAEISASRGLLAGLAPLFGTPEYMAPEQVRNRRNDERTDIYCVGVILYQMLTGVLPFQNEDPWAAAHMRVNGDPVAPRSINPGGFAARAEEIVLHAMRLQSEGAVRLDCRPAGRACGSRKGACHGPQPEAARAALAPEPPRDADFGRHPDRHRSAACDGGTVSRPSSQGQIGPYRDPASPAGSQLAARRRISYLQPEDHCR